MTYDEETERRREYLRSCHAAFDRSQMASMDASWRLPAAVAGLVEQMSQPSAPRD